MADYSQSELWHPQQIVGQLVALRRPRADDLPAVVRWYRDAEIARDVVSEIRSRLVFLEDVGLNYLTLDRASRTLSGGEAQRIRLATQVGSGLVGCCYVLDEPTIGLHRRDNDRLLEILKQLRNIGNTVLVVEMLGKYNRIMVAGFNVKVPLLERMTARKLIFSKV